MCPTEGWTYQNQISQISMILRKSGQQHKKKHKHQKVKMQKCENVKTVNTQKCENGQNTKI